jgi:hypothetical protein
MENKLQNILIGVRITVLLLSISVLLAIITDRHTSDTHTEKYKSTIIERIDQKYGLQT